MAHATNLVSYEPTEDSALGEGDRIRHSIEKEYPDAKLLESNCWEVTSDQSAGEISKIITGDLNPDIISVVRMSGCEAPETTS